MDIVLVIEIALGILLAKFIMDILSAAFRTIAFRIPGLVEWVERHADIK